MIKFKLPYILQEMENINVTDGNTEMKPRPKIQRSLDIAELAREASVHQCRGVSQVEIQTIMEGVLRELKEQLAQGNSVKLNGIGIFSPSLSDVRRDKHINEEGEQVMLPQTQSIHVTGINFRVDKQFIRDVDDMAEPMRVGISTHQHSPYSKEQRLSLLHDYLHEHHFIKVKAYASLVQLSESAANKELNLMCDDPITGITSTGRYSQKIYVLSTN